MRSTTRAILSLTTLAAIACGGQQAAPLSPPPAPPPAETASAAPPPADTTPPPPPKPSLAELIPQTLKGIGDAFNAHDAKKLMSYYADDASFQAYGMPEGHGREDGVKMMQGFFDAVSEVKSAATRVWIKGNIAASELVWSGTMTSDFMGIKASKKPIGASRLHILWFNDDGLVKEVHEYADEAGTLAQMKGAKGAPPVPTVPASPPEVHVGKGTPDEDKLADWAKGLDEVFSKDDVKAVTATMADDADYWLNISGGPATKGKKDMTKELTAWFKAFPDQKWMPTNAWGIDGYAIIEHTLSGTQKGPMGPIPASNKPVSNWHWVDIMQPNADQKMLHGWGFTNLVEMLSQTGAIKPPTEKPQPMATKGDAMKPAVKNDKDTAKGPKADAPKGDAAKEPKKK
jgi:ketosteroid isomerase-like protein